MEIKYLVIEDTDSISSIFKISFTKYIKEKHPEYKPVIDIVKSIKEYREKYKFNNYDFCTVDWQLEDGTSKEILVTSIIPIGGLYATYELPNTKHHTYLAEDIIVHNSCFLPGTQINLANGSYKSIEDIQIGDIVKVYKENPYNIKWQYIDQILETC